MHLWGLLAAVTGGGLVAACAAATVVGGALVGLIFRGAATAWREERDAAVEKSDRLEETVNEQATKIVALERKVGELEKRTDYESHTAKILNGLTAVERSVAAQTVALEFLIKQVFPTAVVPVPSSTDAA